MKKASAGVRETERLLNFRETKRSNVIITYPELKDLYDAIVYEKRTVLFPHAGII